MENNRYVQTVLDALASKLARPVLVETRDHVPVAYSRQPKIAKEAPPGSIPGRPVVAAAVTQHVIALGLAQATAPRRVAADPEIGIESRICAPLRNGSTLLGYLWILDPDAKLTEGQLDLVAESADQVAFAWARALPASSRNERDSRLLRGLLQGSPAKVVQTEREICDARIFHPDSELVVHIVTPLAPGRRGRFVGASDTALAEVRAALRTSRALQGEIEGEGALITVAELSGPELSKRIHRAVAGATGSEVAVGVSAPTPLFEISEGIHQARFTVDLACSLEGPTILAWDEIGVYKMLSGAIGKRPSTVIHPGLLRLLEDPGHENLVETLECYLDNGCDAKRTAAELFLHRTSLYYRLTKIEEIAGVDIHSGDDRLNLHLGLKFARLSDSTAEKRQRRPRMVA